MMLQLVLPAEIRHRITKQLFSQYVSADEIAFARELYMDTIQLATMQRCGMAIGAHGNSHIRLNSLEPEQQVAEIDMSLSFLRAIGCPADDYWLMCYPYGEWNRSLLDILQAKHCRLGFTTEVAIADLEKNHPLLLPRLDTNDFPKSYS
jgi:peptidoglycan/xylan/chitin deacetylase (PgdA/CDA1 family)